MFEKIVDVLFIVTAAIACAGLMAMMVVVEFDCPMWIGVMAAVGTFAVALMVPALGASLFLAYIYSVKERAELEKLNNK